MKPINRALAMLLAFVLLLNMVPSVFAEESAVSWSVEGGVLTISGSGIMCPEDEPFPDDWPSGDGIIAIVVEEGITDVADFAFDGFEELTTVTLADSVHTVGYAAFEGCTALTEVTMPYGIHVEKDAFRNTPWLENLARDENGFAIYKGILLYYDGEEQNIEIPDSVVSVAGDFTDTELCSVHLPDSVTTLGAYAFYNQGTLEQINFPDSLKYIGSWAFESAGLIEAILPESVEYLGNGVFAWCDNLTAAHIPDSRSYLGDSMFQWCTALENVTLGEGIDGIPSDMFYYCDSLQEVKLPSTITYIGDQAFGRCYELKEIVIPAGVTFIGYNAFWDCWNMTSVELPEGLKNIGSNAFDGCLSLQQMNLPESMKTFDISGLETTPWIQDRYDENGYAVEGQWLLSYRGGDTAVVIPDSVKRIAGHALNACDSKENITSLKLPGKLEYIGVAAFYGCSGLTELTIPDTVTFIDDVAFYQCSGLKSLVIPDSVKAMSYASFGYCEGLTELTISANVREIPEDCFRGCSSLEHVEIPDGVTSIGCWAFYDCDEMESITIPASVTTIEHEAVGYRTDDYYYDYSERIYGFTIYGYSNSAAEAYANENSINFVSLDAPVEHIHDYTYTVEIVEPTCTEPGYTTHTCECGESYVDDHVEALGHEYEDGSCVRCGTQVPDYSGLVYEVYEDHVKITGYTGEPVVLEIPAEIEGLPVTNVADFSFFECYSLQEITIPETVTRIGLSAFLRCENLTRVHLSEGLTWIWDDAFGGCISLSEITIPDSVEDICYYAFANCDSLTTVTIPAGVTDISGNVFAHCDNLTAIEVDPANSDYCSQNGALYSKDMTELLCCPGGTEGAFTVPASVEDAYDAFDGCCKLTQILVAEGNANFRSQEGFLLNADLTELVRCPNGKSGHITIPASVTVIGAESFEDCALITGVTIPDGVTGILTAAFAGCSSLTEISIPDSVESIGFSAFDSCTSLTSVKLPNGLRGLSEGIFYCCSALTDITLPDSLEYIMFSAFECCTSLVSITIPNSVTYIDEYAFVGCTALTTVDLPDEIESISYALFMGCTSLTDIVIPDSVTSIRNDAFVSCYSLGSITIPASVTEIGNSAFAWSGLNDIYFKGDAPEFGETCFENVTATAYYPMDNATWTTDVMQGYGGNITWVPYNPNHTHEYSAVVSNPTCTEGGFTTYTCACGESYVDDYTDALGHDLGEWAVVTEPTCTENGMERSACSRCDYYEERVTDATGHSYTAVTTAPTCTEQGFTTYTCACGESYIDDYTDALGHDYQDGTCTRCGGEDPDYEKPVENPFTDVPAGSFYEAPVLWAVENGITNGASADSFNPNGECQRAHVVTFLWRAAGQPEPISTENPFVDVKETDFYYKAVLWAVEKGITNGVDATHFGPFAYCNRAQVVTFLYRAMGSPAVTATECPFTDVAPGSWFEAPILWAVENGITNGMGEGIFGVNTICNRAQVVTFLYRTYVN